MYILIYCFLHIVFLEYDLLHPEDEESKFTFNSLCNKDDSFTSGNCAEPYF